MNKDQMRILINEKHEALFQFLSSHDDNKWNEGPEGKWTAGQHVIHLIQTAKPLNTALRMPKFLLQYKYGKANRPNKTYEEIVANYYGKMAALDREVVSPFSKNMPSTPPSGKGEIIATLDNQKEKLVKQLGRLSNKELDKYLLPHPLMGRMILREIIMWSAFHVEHHHKVLLEKY